MAEHGARPRVPVWRLRLLRSVRAFFTPLLPDDYLELINPLWSTRELRGRIERITRETADAATVLIRPGWEWPGHEPGQYLRVGMAVDGIHHWRAYSLTSEPDRADGCISITPKLVEAGKVSSHLVRDARPGTIVRLGGVEGAFVLPHALPDKLLFVSAGSGITPIMSMLRSLAARGALTDVVLLHSARGSEDFIFGPELRELARRHDGFRLHEQHTAGRGRMSPQDLQDLCPDWRERDAFLSGPGAMLDAMAAHWERHGDRGRLHMERFQPVIGTSDAPHGAGGEVRFSSAGVHGVSDGTTPILVAGERAGATLPYGCRMGICHTCVGRLCSGRVRDLRTGAVSGVSGELVRTCINAPEGDVEIQL
jgi:stearoyl-CoA 9-desaturase NADPH oxidoreductase